MTPAEQSRRAVAAVARLLRRRGLRVATQPHAGGLFVYLGGRCLDVQVRVASLHVRRHHVTWRGRRYSYLRRFWHWNLHRHGRRVVADVWALCFAGQPASRALVVPSLEALSVSLLDAKHRRSWLWRQRGAWACVDERRAA
jgi:hypothetical protein